MPDDQDTLDLFLPAQHEKGAALTGPASRVHVLNVRALASNGLASRGSGIAPGALWRGLPVVYVGRPNALWGLPGHPLANPYPLERESERGEVLARFERWLNARIEAGDRGVIAALDELERICLEHGGIGLVCWCNPKTCHADAVRETLIQRLVQRPASRHVAPPEDA